ncbi:MAG TPA: L-lactate dehydrogenase [Clostridiaceae bacterium]
MKLIRNKVVIIGAGMVGSAVLSSLLNLELIAEVVLIDSNKNRARGEALDAFHTTSFAYSPNVRVRAGEYSDCRDAQLIIVTAGASAKPGDNITRLDLATINIKVVNDIMENVTKQTKDAIIIMVTNPVDIVTYVASKFFDYPKEKIFGTGTLLDTARLRRILALRYLVDTKNVHGYILGEHGGSAFAAWSHVNIAGIPVEELDNTFNIEEPINYEDIFKEVLGVGFEILQLKGYTNAGIAMSVSRIVKAILLNELSILPVSTTLEGEYDIYDVALSIPCIVTSEGIGKKLIVPLSTEERELLKISADKLSSVLIQLKLK